MERIQPSDTWEQGASYEQYIGRWSRAVAPLFVRWLSIPAGRKWVDVGCGTGALSQAIVDHGSPASVLGVEPSEGFLSLARKNLADRALFSLGRATEIPLAEGAVDVVVSGLVLNFVADPCAGLAEMARVTTRGGTIGAYVWDYAGKMEFLRLFWDSVAALNPQAVSLDEGVRFPLCRPDALVQLFTAAGLRDVQLTSIETPTRFASFDDFWQPFLGGQGPAPAYTMSLDEGARARLRDHLRSRVQPETDQSLLFTARAWAVRGVVGG